MQETIVQFVQSLITNNEDIAYLIIFVGMFFDATFPFAFFWYGEFIIIPVSILLWLGKLKFWWVIFASLMGALCGDMINYYLGYYYGRKLFRPGKRFLNEENLAKWEELFKKYGTWGIVLAKFVPIIPWTVSFLAWLHRMPFVVFIIIDIVSGAVIFSGIYGAFSGAVYVIKHFLF